MTRLKAASFGVLGGQRGLIHIEARRFIQKQLAAASAGMDGDSVTRLEQVSHGRHMQQVLSTSQYYFSKLIKQFAESVANREENHLSEGSSTSSRAIKT